MKNKLIIGVVVVVVLAGGGIVYFATRSEGEKAVKTSKEDSFGGGDYYTVKACDAFTLNHAKQVLGDSAVEGSNTPDTSSSDITVSSCTYTTSGTAVKDIRIATLLARSAKTKAGADSNTAIFGSARPVGVQEVSGYGDAAFFDPKLGQLNILKEYNWYIMSVSGTNPANATVSDARKLADVVVPHL